MSNVMAFCTFKLKKGVNIADFMLASDKVNNEIFSVQKGYISRSVMVDGDVWGDYVLLDSMEAAERVSKAVMENPVAGEFMAFIDESTFNVHHFVVQKTY